MVLEGLCGFKRNIIRICKKEYNMMHNNACNIQQVDISVIIPVYGVEKYIDRFMEGLKSQTVQNFKLVVVNDKTKDGAIQRISSYKEWFQDRLVILENEKNLGLSSSRNTGLDYVEEHPTKYISFLDPDDWVENTYFQDMYETSEAHQLDLCMSGVIRNDDDTGKIMCVELVNMPEKVFADPSECHELAYINPCAYSKLYLFEPIHDLRFRQVKRSEDTCYLFEALLRYKSLKFTNHALYHYCVRDTSLTGTIDDEKYESMHAEFARMMPIFDTEHSEMLDLFVAQVFIRSSLGGVCRLSFGNMRNARIYEKRELVFLNEFVPSWKCNKYLNFGKKVIGDKKEYALRVCAGLYKRNLFVIFIWAYFVMSRVLKKEVRA